jgi:hypothetical protein
MGKEAHGMSTSRASLRPVTSLAGILLVIALAGRPSRCAAQDPAPVPAAIDAPLPGSPLGTAPAPAPLVRGPFGAPTSAWFAGVEVGLFHAVNPVGTFVTGANVKMDFTAEPRVELGYRFDDGGALRVAWRAISSSGTGKALYPDSGAPDPHLHLEVNTADLDYVSGAVPGLLREQLSFEAGLRFASKLLDSRGGDGYDQLSVRSLFAGTGPHFGLTSWRSFERGGFALFSRFDVALVFGGEQDRSAFAPLPSAGYGGSPVATFSHWDPRVVGDATAQLGVSWAGTVRERLWVRTALGVEAEYVGFGAGQLADFSNNNVHALDGVLSVGPFFHCEIAY